MSHTGIQVWDVTMESSQVVRPFGCILRNTWTSVCAIVRIVCTDELQHLERCIDTSDFCTERQSEFISKRDKIRSGFDTSLSRSHLFTNSLLVCNVQAKLYYDEVETNSE